MGLVGSISTLKQPVSSQRCCHLVSVSLTLYLVVSEELVILKTSYKMGGSLGERRRGDFLTLARAPQDKTAFYAAFGPLGCSKILVRFR